MDIMGNLMPKIFISYTIRDGNINRDFLNQLQQKISFHCEVYIDLIHNDSVDKQDRVIKELNCSDFMVLIRTERIDASEWVEREILLANQLKIPIVEFEFAELIKKEFQPIITAINNFTLRDEIVHSQTVAPLR